MKKLLIALIVLFAIPAHADELQNVILVNAIGEVEVPVNTVTFYLNINTRNKDMAKAKAENEKKYKDALATLDKLGLGKESIISNSVSVNPSYVPCYPTPENPSPKCDQTKIDFYNVNRSMQIKLAKLEKYDAVIEGLSKATLGDVSTGQYDIAEKTKYKDQARDLAIDSAKAKAEKIAKKIGVTLKKPVRFESFDDEVNAPVRPMMAKMVNAEMAGGAADMATDPGTLGKVKVRVTVNIAYGIE